MKECDTQISSILKEQQELQRKISETNLERKRMENEVTCYVPCVFSAYSGSNSDTLFPVFFPPRQVRRMETDQKDCSLKVQKLIEKHAWITSEKQLFGRSGTDYDFASRDPHKAKKDFEKLQADQSGYDHIVCLGMFVCILQTFITCFSSFMFISLEKRVNKKVIAMFEKAEDEYNDLISKKNIIEVCNY